MSKVFLSATYADLKQYREKVISRILKLEDSLPITMEHFTADENDPQTVSLVALNRCNIYIGIIGHRYGTIPPHHSKSITHLEYERAYERYKNGEMNLYLFLAANDGAHLSPDLIESDDIRARHRDFRNELRQKHTPAFFTTPDDLADMVAAALLKGHRALSPKKSVMTIFDEGDAATVFRQADAGMQGRYRQTDELIVSMAESFRTLFELDYKTLSRHPFFRDVQKRLEPILAGLNLDEKAGVLERARIRHVILRSATVHEILSSLDPHRLETCGKTIGKKAARDLVEHTLKGRNVPSTPEAFVALWDYWDCTGGWGKMYLIPSNAGACETPSRPSTQWVLEIKNSFLRVDGDVEQTGKLARFWCGYIEGFLDEALPQIDKMMRDIDRSERERLTLPSFHAVAKVTHECRDCDRFTVEFEQLQFSIPLEHIAQSKRALNDSEWDYSLNTTRCALLATREILGNADYIGHVQNANIDEKRRRALRDMKFDDLAETKRGRAQEAYSMAKELIDDLSEQFRTKGRKCKKL